jgi:hypothetical protein
VSQEPGRSSSWARSACVSLAVAAGLACAPSTERLALVLAAQTRAVIVVEEDAAGSLRVTAFERDALERAPVLWAVDVMVLEYDDTLVSLGLVAGVVPPGSCRGLPEPSVARSRRRGTDWRVPAEWSARARDFRLGCEGCASGEVSALGRCCAERRASDGTCVARCPAPIDGGACAAGTWLAADGVTCLTRERCAAPNVADDLSGTCHLPGECGALREHHDGGDGRCVPAGTCAPGFVEAGDGVCVAPGTCARGSSRDGDGRCVLRDECSDGLHDDGAGVCVPGNTCTAGYGWVEGLGCLPRERCPAGQHDGGDGACVGASTCSAGFRLDAAGVCYRWRTLAPLAQGRLWPVVGRGRGLDLVVAGGSHDTTGASTRVELYDAARDSWRAAPDLPEPAVRATGIELPDGRLMIVGGARAPDWTPRAEVHLLDAEGCARSIARAPEEPRRMGAMAGLLGRGEIVLTGGFWSWADKLTRETTELYSPASRTWRAAGVQPEPLAWATVARLDADRLMVAMGNVGSAHDPSRRVLEYDARTQAWRTLPELLTPRVTGPLVRLPSGALMLAGGNLGGDADTPTADVELYDPRTEVWRSTTPLTEARWSHGLVTLCDRRVLAVAGVGSSSLLATAEIYDPRTTRWTSAGTTGVARLSPSVVRRPDCSVVVLGGANRWEESSAATPTAAHREVVVYESPGLKAP